jgi:toxin ParE1/3/4
MTHSYRLTATAERDIEQILEFIARRDGVGRALSVQGSLEKMFRAIVRSPGSGRKRPHLTGQNIRWRTVFHYLVLYDPGSRPITMLRVLHGARDIDRILPSGGAGTSDGSWPRWFFDLQGSCGGTLQVPSDAPPDEP